MAQVTVTLKITLDEANLLVKALQSHQSVCSVAMSDLDRTSESWRSLGSEKLGAEALARQLRSAR